MTRPGVIPNPNRCNETRITPLSVGTWQSEDCPLIAVCVPSDFGSYCSCSFSDDLFEEDKSGRCVPSNASFLLGAAWMVLVCVVAVVTVWMLHGLILLRRNGRATNVDFVQLTCILALVSCVLYVLSRGSRGLLLLHYFDPEPLATWDLVKTVFTALYGGATIAQLLVYGLVVRSLMQQSSRLRRVNFHGLRIQVCSVAFVVGVLLLLGAMVLLASGQFSLSFGFSALFTVILLGVYHQAIQLITKVSQRANDSNLGAPLTNRNNDFSTNLKHICHTTRRLFVMFCIYVLVAVIENIMWFVGHSRRLKGVLREGIATTMILQFAILAAGLICMGQFIHKIAHGENSSMRTRLVMHRPEE